jgi:hypothetical protein
MNKHSIFALSAAVAAVGAGSQSEAHHAGGVGNAQGAGPINTISASTLERGHSVAGITVDYTSFDTLSDETLIEAHENDIEDVHGLDTIQSYSASYSYGVTDDLMVTLRLPVVKRTGIRAVEHQHEAEELEQDQEPEIEDHGNPTGIGDLSLLAQYRFLNNRASRTEAAVLLGVKAPTGETDERHGEELLDAEFQPGSGAWDALFGLALTRRVGPWSFDANVLYALVTEGTQRTDLGDLFLYNAAISYRLTSLAGPAPMFHGAHSHAAGDDGDSHAPGHKAGASKGAALDLVLELNGEWHDKQETAGVTDENSGGTTIYISPGLRLTVDQWSGIVSVGIPVVTDLNGIQAEQDWRISAGTSLAF